MCGIVGVVSNAPVNQLIYDALLLLQHRGQDAAGIVTQQDRKFFMHKAKGMVRDVFRTRNMRSRVARASTSGSCTATMPPGPQAMPQVPMAVSNNAWPWPKGVSGSGQVDSGQAGICYLFNSC